MNKQKIDKSLSQVNKHPRDDRIVFFEEPHIYEIDGLSKDYISVTTFICLFTNGFNADVVIDLMMSSKYWNMKPYFEKAIRWIETYDTPSDNVSVDARKIMETPNWKNGKYGDHVRDEIKKEWKEKADIAKTLGTEMHLHIENWYNNKDIPDHYKLNKEWEYFINFTKAKTWQVYRTEWMIFDEVLKLAGSIDVVFKDPNDPKKIILGDWKRTKDKIVFNSMYASFMNNEKAINAGLSDLQDVNGNKYSLQLNLYKYILEKNYDIVVSKMFLIRIHPSADNFEIYKVKDMQNNIEKMMTIRSNHIKNKK